MRVTLVVPGLGAAASAGAAEARVLARIAAYGRAEDGGQDLDGALVAATGLPADTAIAPIAALGAGFDPGASYVLRADPVALVAGRDDVLLAGRIDDLERDDAEALRATLAAHFAGDGLDFHLPRPDAWFLTATTAIPVDAAPLAAIAGPIQPFLPRGPHGKTWRRWLSEMQMLLHAHPVNAAREARGQLPATGIWIASGGTLPRSTSPLRTSVYAAAGAAGDVARGAAALAGAPARALPSGFAALDGADAVVALDRAADADAVARTARAWLDPALAALVRGALEELAVIGDGGGRVQRWSATAPSLLDRIRAKLRGAPRAS